MGLGYEMSCSVQMYWGNVFMFVGMKLDKEYRFEVPTDRDFTVREGHYIFSFRGNVLRHVWDYEGELMADTEDDALAGLLPGEEKKYYGECFYDMRKLSSVMLAWNESEGMWVFSVNFNGHSIEILNTDKMGLVELRDFIVENYIVR